MEIQGLWDVVVKQFAITVLVRFVCLIIEIYATTIIQ